MQVSGTDDGRIRPADPADVERSLVGWLRDELEDPDITGADNFLDIGGHSLTFAKLNQHLSDSFGAVLDMKTTYEEPLGVAVTKIQPVESTTPTTR
ncbi:MULTISPECIES: acyl carrier protein [unclassified Streptomyces]|uniref:acyl carrier protein n=1 Tax=unclassified Streptomyces TaxID=2593676 RepID=UPI002E7853E6|nr:acyl carrier protein [Streptomyces sp. JV184]MEE1745578.1 acyl carrier protein [Streptomyces sp. JV184]